VDDNAAVVDERGDDVDDGTSAEPNVSSVLGVITGPSFVSSCPFASFFFSFFLTLFSFLSPLAMNVLINGDRTSLNVDWTTVFNHAGTSG